MRIHGWLIKRPIELEKLICKKDWKEYMPIA